MENMKEYYILATLLFFVVRAQNFPNCGRNFSCKSLNILQLKVDGILWKLKELPNTQWKLNKLQNYFLLDKDRVELCAQNLKQLKKEVKDLNDTLEENLIKNIALEQKLEKLEEVDDRFDISNKLKELETSENIRDERLNEVIKRVNDTEQKNQEEFANFRKYLENKVNKSEFFVFKNEVNSKLRTINKAVNSMKELEKNISFQKNLIIQQQQKSIETTEELKIQIQQLRIELYEIRSQAMNTNDFLGESLDNKEISNEEDTLAVLKKANDRLKQLGNQSSNSSTSMRSEETFFIRNKP